MVANPGTSTDMLTAERWVVRRHVTAKRLADLIGAPVLEVIKHLMRCGIMVSVNQPLDGEYASQVAGAFCFDLLDLAEPHELPESLNARRLSEILEVTPVTVIKTLLGNGVVASVNQTVDFEAVVKVANDLGFEVASQPIVRQLGNRKQEVRTTPLNMLKSQQIAQLVNCLHARLVLLEVSGSSQEPVLTADGKRAANDMEKLQQSPLRRMTNDDEASSVPQPLKEREIVRDSKVSPRLGTGFIVRDGKVKINCFRSIGRLVFRAMKEGNQAGIKAEKRSLQSQDVCELQQGKEEKVAHANTNPAMSISRYVSLQEGKEAGADRGDKVIFERKRTTEIGINLCGRIGEGVYVIPFGSLRNQRIDSLLFDSNGLGKQTEGNRNLRRFSLDLSQVRLNLKCPLRRGCRALSAWQPLQTS